MGEGTVDGGSHRYRRISQRGDGPNVNAASVGARSVVLKLCHRRGFDREATMGDASISITPWHATIFAELGRVRLDVVDEIVYDQGRFFASSHPVGTPPISRTELGGPELRDLA